MISFVNTSVRSQSVLKRRRRMPQNRLLSRRSSTTITSTEDITRNGGTIEGVWIFSRHGDRTPCRSLSSPHMADAESLENEVTNSRPAFGVQVTFSLLSSGNSPVECWEISGRGTKAFWIFDTKRCGANEVKWRALLYAV